MSYKYYSATKERNTLQKHVPAPYIRKSFNVANKDHKFILDISVVGIYELYVNGKNISKGCLLPYRTNPNHIVYVDTYELNKYLVEGENVIGVMLGNGFSNSVFPGWDFDKLSWAHSPKIALEVKEDNTVIFDISSFKCHDSEVIFDDFHSGEHIDKNKEIKGWDKPSFNDSNWNKMIEVESPKGELRKHPGFYPTIYETVKPVKVIKGKGCYLYDFGMSFSGQYDLKIKGERNKTVKLFVSDAINEDKTIFVKMRAPARKILALCRAFSAKLFFAFFRERVEKTSAVCYNTVRSFEIPAGAGRKRRPRCTIPRSKNAYLPSKIFPVSGSVRRPLLCPSFPRWGTRR